MPPSMGAVTAERVRRYMVRVGRRYWPRDESAVMDLPVVESGMAANDPGFLLVELPPWAADLGVGAPPALLVADSTLVAGAEPAHRRCDWWLAAFLHLNGALERSWEQKRGPAHSYAFRLGADPRLFDHAWVNRILLFLRRAAARHAGQGEAALFGALPDAQLVLTHDLDVIGRPAELRLKYGAFQLFNATRLALRGQVRTAAGRLRGAMRLALGGEDLCNVDRLLERTRRHGRSALLFVYAGVTGWSRGLSAAVVDPSYALADPRLRAILSKVRADGWHIGLHPSFSSWHRAQTIAAERERLQHALGVNVTACRQHWLRFSWGETWRAQVAAGLRLDMTLGFNDRPGFRNGAALAFEPWNPDASEPHRLTSLPTILMDSQFFDYDPDTATPIGDRIGRWIDEVRAVRGVAAVLWHPHTLHPDIGWGAGFEELLERLGPGGLPAELGLGEAAN